MSTLYHVLGLPQGASHEQVKAAFRALARRFHPDVNGGNNAAEQRFKEVNQAYETLADPGARADYDRALVCRAAEMRQRRWAFAATAATTFALTTSAIGLALWWSTPAMRGLEPARASVPDAAGSGHVVSARGAKQANGQAKGPIADLATPAASPEGRGRVVPDAAERGGPIVGAQEAKLASDEAKEPAAGLATPAASPEGRGRVVPDAAERAPIVGAQEAKLASGEEGSTADLATPVASAEGRGSGSSWATYRSARFSFALRYPADMFAYDLGPSSENVRTFVSQSGAILHIFAADNIAGTTLTRYRRSRMETRYGGGVFDKVPQRKFGFVLSGTQGGSAFYERVTFACDDRAIYGWQMIYPVSRRTLYDLVAHKVDRTYTQTIRPSARCSESLSSAGGEGRHHRALGHWKTARHCWLKHGYYWKCDYHRYRNYY